MKRYLPIIYTLFIVSLCYGQEGNIQGNITDVNGIQISGAVVRITDVNKGTVSDFDGKFTLVNIPEGVYKLKIEYLGFSDVEQEVEVISNETTSISILLKSESILLDNVNITSYTNSAQSRALNKQKNNINITNVISTDQIGKFPDSNVGDAIKRVPGISIQVDQGEARDIIVRGLSPQLNSVTLNGSRIPSAEGDNRNIQLDLIPSDMIQTIEVSKALTPDMDADALGGSVNLVTRTSPQDFRVSATLGSGINFITNEGIWNGSFLIGDRSKNNKFGWMVSASINDSRFGSDNIEAEWTDKFSYNSGVIDQDGNTILEEVTVNPYTNVLEQQTHLIQRVRRSFAVNFDYQINNNHDLFLKTIYNWRDDRENRFVFENEVLSGEDIELDDFTITNGTLTRFPVEVSRQTRGGVNTSRSQNARLEDQRFQNYTIGGNHLLGAVKFDWITSYSKAFEESTNDRIIEFKSEYTIFNDNSIPRLPLFIPVNPTDTNNLGDFLYEDITEEVGDTAEEDFNFIANAEVPVNLFNFENGIIKFGAKVRLKSKFRENNFFSFDLSDEFPTLLDVSTRDYSDPNYLVGSQYQAGVFPDQNQLGSLVLDNGAVVSEEFLGQNFTVNEDVFAGYILTKQNISDRLTILAGLRLETTYIEASGNQIEDLNNDVSKITETQSYSNVLPGIHFKYELSKQTILRFAWTNTIARPNYTDLVPTREVVFEDEEIIVGNPDLQATTSMNFDLLAEHYFKSVGIVSTGIFYKNINDFIYTFRSQTENDRFGQGTTGFTLFQPLNGNGASLFGVEIAFQRTLDFLPGFAKNFSLDLNYTYLTSTANGIRDENGIERNDLDIPDTSPNLFNASIGYKNPKFSMRLSANFSDAYLDEIGSSAFRDIFYDKQFFLDLNGSYRIHKNMNFYVGLNNITNQPLRLYQGVSSRTNQVEFYDLKFTFGLKYDFYKK
ncbi:TonB-dependent receptor [Dokdonia pacifica]|uniref:TonB-dependent receptor n=1 Tax=Dokdonia pacifica TaxID=1627892 RepID=A0A238VN27_9FLAO|nr:TonB-dependent receptor [Dokdonia pacifica]GGG19977.1 TonB-dependent receptor [Dokdonia pacifica]SNR35547.1 TonB-dependent receptor [Dokdonia pacifica]